MATEIVRFQVFLTAAVILGVELNRTAPAHSVVTTYMGSGVSAEPDVAGALVGSSCDGTLPA